MIAHTTAAIAQTAAGNSSAARTPWVWASCGITSAPTLTPNGWAVCRIPIATPRCSGGNQPTTRAPLAALLPAAAIPPRNSNADIITSEPDCAAANAAKAVSAAPVASTSRSPRRSTAYPQAISVSTIPNAGIADTRPARARSTPGSERSVGIRKAAPLMNTLAHSVANKPTASIHQRRGVPVEGAAMAF